MISLPGEGLSALVDEDAGEGFGLGGQVASLAKRLGIIAGVGWSDGNLWLEEVAGLRRLGRDAAGSGSFAVRGAANCLRW